MGDVDAPISGDVTGGFSNAALLYISIGGFSLVGMMLYGMILRKSDREEEKDDGNPNRSYEEALDDADVRTLNRAQRRARAKNRMKKNRRIDRGADGTAGGRVGDGVIEAADGDDNDAAAWDDDGRTAARPASERPMSRKERARAAKMSEREERRHFEEERRKQQREAEGAALQERRAREREELEKKIEAERNREEREQTDHQVWKTLSTVVDYVKREKLVNMDELAIHFGVNSTTAFKWLKELEEEKRIFGIFDNRNSFIYVSASDMRAISEILKAKGKISFANLAQEIMLLVNRNVDRERSNFSQ